MVGRADLAIELDQIDVLVLLAVPGGRERLQLGESRLRVRVRRDYEIGRGENNGVGRLVALAVVVDEEEDPVADDRTPDGRTELIEVVRRLGAAVEGVRTTSISSVRPPGVAPN